MTGEININQYSGIQGLYHLEDGTDSKLGNTMTSNGTVTFVSGKFRKGANLGNNVGWLTSVSNQNIGNGAFTLMCWNYPTTSGTTFALIGVGDSATQVYTRFDFNPAGTLRFYRVKSGVTQQGPTVSYTPTLNKWTHYAMTYDGSSVINGYVNGELVATSTGNSGNGTSGGASGSGVGVDSQAFTSNSNGIYDEAVFLNTTLTGVQIRNYYAWAIGRRTSVA